MKLKVYCALQVYVNDNVELNSKRGSSHFWGNKRMNNLNKLTQSAYTILHEAALFLCVQSNQNTRENACVYASSHTEYIQVKLAHSCP